MPWHVRLINHLLLTNSTCNKTLASPQNISSSDPIWQPEGLSFPVKKSRVCLAHSLATIFLFSLLSDRSRYRVETLRMSACEVFEIYRTLNKTRWQAVRKRVESRHDWHDERYSATWFCKTQVQHNRPKYLVIKVIAISRPPSRTKRPLLATIVRF